MSDQRLIIGSRGSKLALVQANIVKSLLNKFHPGIQIDIRIIKTKGDIIQDVPLAKIGDKGLFTKEIETCLLNGEIDLAVHSLKDLPTILPPKLCIGAVLKREDPRDAFISYKFKRFSDLPENSIIATSSLRRRANVLRQRPDIQLVDIRGNVDTRLRKLKENNYDGMILAAAGLIRLGLEDEIQEIIEPELMLPAVTQGVLGIETREDDDFILSILNSIHDPVTNTIVTAERAFLRKLEGGCQVPIGALAQIKRDKLCLQGFISDTNGKQFYRGEITGLPDNAEQVGTQLAEQLLNSGAQKILENIYGDKKIKKKGKIVLVGAGPGDPELITLKGIKFLRSADIVIYDYLANEKLLDYCDPKAEKIYVGKSGANHTLSQDQINKLLIEKATEYKLVVRLKGGDPLIFGRGGEEALAFYNEGVEFEVIPGITSGIAALNYAGIPATHRGDATSVSFITGHEDPTKKESGLNWQAIANIQGTLVFYMGVKNLPIIVKNLIDFGRPANTPVALIRWGTLPSQETVTGTLNNIFRLARERKIKPPSLIVVGEVVRHREKMNWFERKPLFGKRIVITRARAQNSDLVSQLAELGANIIEAPTIKIEPPSSWQPLDNAIAALDQYHWIIFTSVNGVDSFQGRLSNRGFDVRKLYHNKIATIGPATSQRLRQYGISPDLQPPKFVAESLIESLRQQTEIAGKRFLLPRAEEARVVLKEELIKQGAKVDEVVAYRTIVESNQKGKDIQQILAGQVDLITFTSSSTVGNFVKLIGKNQINGIGKAAVACIGPITKQTAADYGFNVKIMPDQYTIPALTRAIVDFYSR